MARSGLHRLADAVAALPATVTDDAAQAVVAIAADEARRATRDGRLSGMGRRGPRLRATATVRPQAHRATATVVGVPAGPWALLNAGARAHTIGPRARGATLAGPGLRHPVSFRIRHPGARGKGTWRAVAARARRDVPPLYIAAAGRALR